MAMISSAAAGVAAVADGSSAQGMFGLQQKRSDERTYPLRNLDREQHWHRRRRRRLQAAGGGDECAGAFTLTSLLWADSTGCYEDIGQSIYEYMTEGGSTYIIAPIPMFDSADSPIVWVAGEVIDHMASETDSVRINPHCHSDGDTTEHAHPGDVKLWICDIDNTGDSYTEVTADQFGTTCGCSAAGSTPAPAPAPASPARGVAVTPTPAAVVTSDTPNGLCGELQPLTVVAAALDLAALAGCYRETGHEYVEEGGHFFSITGMDARDQLAVFPGYVDAASMDPRWFLGYIATTASRTVIYCVSAQSPAEGHPSTADWYCDNGSGSFPLVTDEQFMIECGCEGAATPPAAGGGATGPPADTGSDHAGSEHTGSDHTGGGHTTSAEEDGHSGSGDHSGTPAPTTVARGIVGPNDTPEPSPGVTIVAADTSAAARRAAASWVLFGRGSFVTAVAFRTAAAAGAARLLAAFV